MTDKEKERDRSLNDEKDLLYRVYSYIAEQEDPHIEVLAEHSLIINGHLNRFDLYLPDGYPLLNRIGPTVIELKNRLGADTLYRYHEYFSTYLKNEGIGTFILIYNDKNAFPTSLINRYRRYRNKGFFVFSVTTFCKGKKKDEVLQQLPPKESEEERSKRLVENAHAAFIKGHNTLFLGAGVSCSVDVPRWNKFLTELLDKSHNSIRGSDYPFVNESLEFSSIITGRYIENQFQTEDEFEKEMQDVLYKDNPKPDSPLFKELVEFICSTTANGDYCVDQAITFNYDDLLEKAIEKKRKGKSIFNRTVYTENDFPVYHVHGMIPQDRLISSTPVLSETKYHKLYEESYHWSNVVQLFALSRCTCFFIGLSMNDPNLRRLLDISRNGIGQDNDSIESIEPNHYAIMERKPLDKNHIDPVKNEEHWHNLEKMMYQLGINIIWYDNSDGQHLKVPKILEAIRLGKPELIS